MEPKPKIEEPKLPKPEPIEKVPEPIPQSQPKKKKKKTAAAAAAPETNYFMEELKKPATAQQISDIDSIFAEQEKEDQILEQKRIEENRKNSK